MGFSPWGLLVGLAVLAPSMLLVWFPPEDPRPAARVPRPLGWLEHAGRGLCLIVPAVTPPGEVDRWWALMVLVFLIGYYTLWVRYLRSGCVWVALYRPWWEIPVPMAVFPVAAFLATAAWLSNAWIAAAAVILAAGHVPAALLIGRSASSR